MKKVPLQKHQTILDLALQYCGSAEALADIARLNDINETEEVAAGSMIWVPEEIDSKVVKFLSDGNYKPVTGIYNNLPEAQEGLEFWIIELDFIIS